MQSFHISPNNMKADQYDQKQTSRIGWRASEMSENKTKKVTIKFKAIQTEVTAIRNNLNTAINMHTHQTLIF